MATRLASPGKHRCLCFARDVQCQCRAHFGFFHLVQLCKAGDNAGGAVVRLNHAFFNFLSNPLKISKVFSFPQGKNISFLEKIERNQKIKISADIIENMALDRVLKM